MLAVIITILFLVLFPGLTLWSERKSKIVKFISPIVICYLIGIIVGNIPVIRLDKDLISTISDVSISLAIPLLLFNSNVKVWIKYSGKTLFAYALGVAAAIQSSIIGYHFFKDIYPEARRVSGMLIGVYTGGTPNMSAIGLALETPEEIFVLLNSSDVFLGAICFVILISFGKKLFGLFLPPFRISKGELLVETDDQELVKIKRRTLIINVIMALGLGVFILGIAAWISITINGELAGPIVILVLTTLGIGATFFKSVQRMKGSYEAAFYLLLIFSLAIGSMADIRQLVSTSPLIFQYTAFVMSMAIGMHLSMAAIFRIDRDTTIIASTAAIYGSAFIGPVANAIHNRKIIPAGITMGLLGYAIGNYIGIGVGMLLK